MRPPSRIFSNAPTSVTTERLERKHDTSITATDLFANADPKADVWP